MLTDLIRVHRRNKMLSKQIVESFKRKDTNRIPFYDMPKEIKVTIDSIVANSDQISDVSKIKFRRDSKTRSSTKRKRNYCHSSLDQYVYMQNIMNLYRKRSYFNESSLDFKPIAPITSLFLNKQLKINDIK